MHLKQVFLIHAFIFLPCVVWSQDGDAILGNWLTADKSGEITIYRSGDHYFGKIRGGTNEQEFDIHNPDKDRRGDRLLGLIILRDLEFDVKDNMWDNGNVYDPKNGKRYSCNVKLLDPNTLKITGYIGFSWIGRSEEWTRLKR